MRTMKNIYQGRPKAYVDNMARLDFKFFVEQVIGITTFGGIHKFQQEWVNAIEKHDRVMIKSATGHSKTMTIGVWYILWLCWRKKNQEILIISKTLDQSKKTFRHIKTAILQNELLCQSFDMRSKEQVLNSQELITKQNNNIRTVPYNENVRGNRAHFIYCDEADSFEETDTYFEDVTSRVHPGGKIVLTSTPGGPTNLFSQIEAMPSHPYIIVNTPAITRSDGEFFDADTFCLNDFDRAVPIWPEHFSLEVIKAKWFEQGRWKFVANQLCEIVGESESAPFPLRVFMDGCDKKLTLNKRVEESAMYFIGSDFAGSEGIKADYDTYIVIELLNRNFTIKWIDVPPKGMDNPKRIQWISGLYETYNKYGACRVVADETRSGSELIRDLRSIGITTIAQPFQWRLRRVMINTAKNVFQSGRVVVPYKGGPEHINDLKKIQELQNQVTAFTLKTSDAGNENYKSGTVHDDSAMALFMALTEASKMLSSNVRPVAIKNNSRGIKRKPSWELQAEEQKAANNRFNGTNNEMIGGRRNIVKPHKHSLVRLVKR